MPNLLSGRLVLGIIPTNASTKVELNATPTITFTVAMDASSLVNGNIKLLDDSSAVVDAIIGTTDPRGVCISPKVPLNPNSKYTIYINGGANGVKSLEVSGVAQTLASSMVSEFTTTSTNVLPAPSLRLPASMSLVQEPISFSWDAVIGSTKYQLQVARGIDFSDIVFDGETTDVAFSPSMDAVDVGNYFWRVRAVDANAGVWSNYYQFFIEDTNAFDIDDSTDLILVKSIPSNNTAEIRLSTTKITLTFNVAIDPASILTVTSCGIDDLQEEEVAGTTTIDGKKVVFTFTIPDVTDDQGNTVPGTPIQEDTEYVIYLNELVGVGGEEFLENTKITFTSVCSPYYCTVRKIREDLGEFVSEFSNSNISKTIYRVSKWADQISYQPYGTVANWLLGETQSTGTNNIFFQEYVRYETEARLMTRRVLEHSLTHGVNKRLGDLQIAEGSSMVPDINLSLKRLEQLRDEAKALLTFGDGTRAKPTFAVLGETGDPYPATDRRRF